MNLYITEIATAIRYQRQLINLSDQSGDYTLKKNIFLFHDSVRIAKGTKDIFKYRFGLKDFAALQIFYKFLQTLIYSARSTICVACTLNLVKGKIHRFCQNLSI